ncbi:hypothetical protein DQ04_01381060 [Trypanosoma grayi]|uniref:hypothetical protein n=1 Tax=Trypanosoma grayi TaxID=71804 RepID=UPI0004F45E9A|nr:hypothetical protein DQ04_01381060 [Trypanosoma grayi]KEG12850.1 hypothetical protein DQ04_01381060 [Trypanosoma grayi]
MLSFPRLLRVGRTVVRARQSSASPRGVVDGDRLTRWSERLRSGWPQERLLSRLVVGLEGCTSAFNAMNAVRTCMFLGTAVPPYFLSLTCLEEINCLRPRHGAGKPEMGAEASTDLSMALSQVALFGEDSFLHSPASCHLPIVALENYTYRSESIYACRFPSAARLVVGHENNGVSEKYLGRIGEGDMRGVDGNCCAERVLYVPQYGTISSLNVVTSMGIALFYALLDAHYPLSRTLNANSDGGRRLEGSSEWEALRAYQCCFQEQLPTTAAHGGLSRVDQRPIHPLYYKRSITGIVEFHRHLRELLLRLCSKESSSLSGARFGLSVLYENGTDQRSLGGIIRSANAFLVDQVCYFGRKKINVVGTIGTQHYTPPVYMGASYDEVNSADEETWAAALYQRVEEANGVPSTWWFFDCGHAFLYADTFEDTTMQGDAGSRQTRSSTASLSWYETHIRDGSFALSLCDTEKRLREAAQGGVVLLVPQEGILPPFHLLQRCKRLLTLLPSDHFADASATAAAGLPVSVAAGIALQRLGSVMHPQVAAL